MQWSVVGEVTAVNVGLRLREEEREREEGRKEGREGGREGGREKRKRGRRRRMVGGKESSDREQEEKVELVCFSFP